MLKNWISTDQFSSFSYYPLKSIKKSRFIASFIKGNALSPPKGFVEVPWWGGGGDF